MQRPFETVQVNRIAHVIAPGTDLLAGFRKQLLGFFDKYGQYLVVDVVADVRERILAAASQRSRLRRKRCRQPRANEHRHGGCR